VKVSIAVRNTELNALSDSAAGGLLQIFPGFQPANPETMANEDALVTLRLDSPAFDKAVNGAIALRPTVGDRTVEKSGRPVWFRIWRRDGVTAVGDGKIGKAKGDMILPVADLPAGAEVEIESLTIELPMEAKA
jgi:hypothetical protein